MDKKTEISLDKLPIRRLEVIEENGFERFPSDLVYDEKTISQIRRIDFAWAVKDSNKKQKTSSSNEISAQSLPWQNMIENLHLAHQELSVIIDLINTVEANDAVTVAGMNKPKQLPNELLADLAVSSATKLQCFRHLSKYFKQSAKALEEQVTREARFYGALIRLQQNWKVKRQRSASSVPVNEGFYIDLLDNSQYDETSMSRSSISTLRIDRNPAGMLAICLPSNSCRSLHFGFLGAHSGCNPKKSNRFKSYSSNEDSPSETTDDDKVKDTHSIIREVHRTIFSEQVFDFVNCEAFNSPLGVNVTGIRENHLQFSIGSGVSVFMSLVSSEQGCITDSSERAESSDAADLPLDAFDGMKLKEGKHNNAKPKAAFPNHICYEIYMQQLFHEHVFSKAKDKHVLDNKTPLSSHPAVDKSGLLGHFCMSLLHRIFSRKVLVEIESLVQRVPYLCLISHPTWHSRISSWSLFVKVPQSILHTSCQNQAPNDYYQNKSRSQFQTRVVVNDDSINVEGEGAPNTLGLFRGSSGEMCHMNRYECDLVDLPMILLQQFASQVVGWLHKEALMVGIKASHNFLCLLLELDQGETLSLVAHVDPEDCDGCISWWLVMEDGFKGKRKLHADVFEGGSEYRKFLGHLSLDVLYSTLIDLVRLCNGGGNH